MTRMLQENDLETRKKFLEKVIRDMEKVLRNAPEGCLRVSKSGNLIRYYHRTEPNDPSGHYIKKKNMKLASDLAQKAYAQKVLPLAKKELKQLNALQNFQAQERIEQVYEKQAPERQFLIHPIIPPDEIYAAKWLETPYEKKEISNDIPEYYTNNGIRVRSKSEILIADSLNRFHVPYRYECPLSLKGLGVIHPDFTVLNIRQRKEYLWEHLGMMDSEAYSENACKRLEYYMLNGYLPGKNLLLTFETSTRPLNTKVVNKIIQEYLL